tara:strand:+ start:887 stop:1213 length:327 start_codon:yes stop_codon:yes gene_type:complete
MKAKTIIMKLKWIECILTDRLGREVKLTHNNIDDYYIEILKTPSFGKTIFQHIKTYLSMKNNYWLNLGTLAYERLSHIKDFDNHFNKKLIDRDKKACYFENKNLTKVA